MGDEGEASTDQHTVKRGASRKPAHPAWQTVIATAVSGLLVGGGFGLVRKQDVDQLNTRIERIEVKTEATDRATIELKADSKNQDRKLDDIKLSVDSLRVSVDLMRDRMPRN